MRKPTIKKNYRLPEELVFWMRYYCKHNGITETQLIIDSLGDYRREAQRRSRS